VQRIAIPDTQQNAITSPMLRSRRKSVGSLRSMKCTLNTLSAPMVPIATPVDPITIAALWLRTLLTIKVTTTVATALYQNNPFIFQILQLLTNETCVDCHHFQTAAAQRNHGGCARELNHRSTFVN
jgi:hypothetical protein